MSLDRKTITFRPLALLPQDALALTASCASGPSSVRSSVPYLHWRLMERGGRLLFPSPWSALLATDPGPAPAASAASPRGPGWRPGRCGRRFRYMDCAARLQTLDRGAPVSTYTVARELVRL